MRDIKFRAWGPHSKYMWPWGELGWQMTADMFNKEHGDKIVMQFTGLKDKNGVEIYEGDILRQLHFKEMNKKKHYLTHSVQWKDELSGWYAQHKSGGKDGSCQLWVYIKNAMDLEVIGNIHENPELLEK